MKVHDAKVVTALLIFGELIVLGGQLLIDGAPFTKKVVVGEVFLRVFHPLVGSFTSPEKRLFVVLVSTITVVVHEGKLVLRRRVTLFSRLGAPLQNLRRGVHAAEKNGQVVLSANVTFFSEILHRFEIGRLALHGNVSRGELVLLTKGALDTERLQTFNAIRVVKMSAWQLYSVGKSHVAYGTLAFALVNRLPVFFLTLGSAVARSFALAAKMLPWLGATDTAH